MYPHAFTAPLSRFGVGRTRKVWYNVLFLPPEIEAVLPFDRHPRLRVEGEVAEIPWEGAWMPTGDGRRYAIVSPAVIAGAGLEQGDEVEMRFAIADQDRVEVPPALEAALRAEPDLRGPWDALTPGKRRALANHVAPARTDATAARRVADVAEALRAGMTLRELSNARKAARGRS
ncbi:MAG: YdeI/OmpD-associated family protein [Paracoccaceae bacterium]